MYPIATTTLSGSASTITLSSIPNTFSHLRLHIYARVDGSSGTNMPIRFNGDATGANYRVHYVGGSVGSNFSGDFGASPSYGDVGWAAGSTDTANSYGFSVVDILDYTNTNKYKTVRAINGVLQTASTGAGLAGLWSSLWMSTSAINSITLLTSAGNFLTNTTVSIYGISTSNATGA
jgi:hypothetical protein